MMIVGYRWMSCSLEQLRETTKKVGHEMGTSFSFFLGGVESKVDAQMYDKI